MPSPTGNKALKGLKENFEEGGGVKGGGQLTFLSLNSFILDEKCKVCVTVGNFCAKSFCIYLAVWRALVFCKMY